MTVETQADAGAGDFVVESKFKSLLFVVAFGVSKSIANLAVGIMADLYGRKMPMLAGWILGLFIPICVIFAPNWDTVVLSNVFLGLQQGICWSLCIFMMID